MKRRGFFSAMSSLGLAAIVGDEKAPDGPWDPRVWDGIRLVSTPSRGTVTVHDYRHLEIWIDGVKVPGPMHPVWLEAKGTKS